MSETEKRPTVRVQCNLPSGVVCMLHEIHKGEFGSARAIATDRVTLKPGANEDIDKEFFDAWLSENKNLSIVQNGSVAVLAEDKDQSDPWDRTTEKTA